jgi:hypothetical protein
MAVLGTPKQMYKGQMAATNTVLYTPPTNTPGAIVKQIVIVNTDTVDRTVSLGVGGTAATVANNCFANTMVIHASATITLDLFTVLNSGDTINGLADAASKVNVEISGLE